MLKQPNTLHEAMIDYHQIISDGIGEKIKKRWPNLGIVSRRFNKLQINLPDSCGYEIIYVMCNEDILVNADYENGPQMRFKYEDPDCINNVLAFVMAILAVPRKDGGRQYAWNDSIDLTEWKRKID